MPWCNWEMVTSKLNAPCIMHVVQLTWEYCASQSTHVHKFLEYFSATYKKIKLVTILSFCKFFMFLHLSYNTMYIMITFVVGTRLNKSSTPFLVVTLQSTTCNNSKIIWLVAWSKRLLKFHTEHKIFIMHGQIRYYPSTYDTTQFSSSDEKYSYYLYNVVHFIIDNFYLKLVSTLKLSMINRMACPVHHFNEHMDFKRTNHAQGRKLINY